MWGFDVVHRHGKWAAESGFELVGLDDDGLCRVNYLSIDLFGVFYSEEAGDAGTVSKHDSVMMFHLDAHHGYFPSLSVCYHCLPRTVICDKSAPVGSNTTNSMAAIHFMSV